MLQMKLNLPQGTLILANLVPIIAVIFFGWSVFEVLIFYWLESFVIGLFNIIKMLIIPSRQKFYSPQYRKSGHKAFMKANIWKVFLIPFFIVHYGAFMSAHLGIIVAVLAVTSFRAGGFWGMAELLNVMSGVGIALLALFISHGISFVWNYIGKKEYLKADIPYLMFGPYKRILVMHVTLFFGAFATIFLKAPDLLLVVFIGVKVFFDLKAHNKEHKGFERKA